jgi:hypothetical protein
VAPLGEGRRVIDPQAEADRLGAERVSGRPLPDPAAMRRLLRGSMAVVAPGEILIVRVSGFSPYQVREYSDALNEPGYLPFRVLVVEGEELGVARTAAEEKS